MRSTRGQHRSVAEERKNVAEKSGGEVGGGRDRARAEGGPWDIGGGCVSGTDGLCSRKSGAGEGNRTLIMSLGSSGPAIERRPLLLVDQHLTRCRHLTQCGALRIFNILSFMPHWHKPLLGRLNLGAAGASLCAPDVCPPCISTKRAKAASGPHRKEARQRCCELVNACEVQARGRKSPVPFSGHAYEFQEENHESTIGPAVNRISARDGEHRPCQRGDVQRDEGHHGPEKCEEKMSHHNLLHVIEQVREPPECKPSQNVARGCEIWCCATE